MRADYIENQNPYEYESVRRLIRTAKTHRDSSRGHNTKRRQSIISHTTSNMWVHGIVHVCENVYEIEHELINLRGICDPERDLKCCSEVQR